MLMCEVLLPIVPCCRLTHRIAFFQVDSTPVKPALSDSMRDRLLREAQVGLDSEKPQTNVLLYIIAAVSVLVILGGKDVFY
jgi:hypothetical protein